jgi:hypothetical protein
VTVCTCSRRGAGANRDGGCMHELRGSVGMLFPYLIWSETGHKGVIDGGAGRVLTGGDGGTAFHRLGCRRAARK